jgi:DNA-binding Lrp family transcriptional regulator
MKPSQASLRSHDVCVALQLVASPVFSYRELARDVGLSVGEAHNSVKRLEQARLFLPEAGGVNTTALLKLLVHGVPYVFPGRLGAESQGVPTAHSGPALAEHLPAVDAIVWPSADGKARGSSLVPLCASAPEFVDSNEVLYRWLTLVDALRVGRARDRRLAEEMLARELSQQGARCG